MEWSEEREAYHQHECPRCGEEWEHGSRQCDGAREKGCWECTPREEQMMGGPGKIEEPAEVEETTEEEAPANEDAGEGEEEEKSS